MLRVTRSASSLTVTSLCLALSYALLLTLFAPFAVRRAEAASGGAGKAPTSTAPSVSKKRGNWRDGELIVRFREAVSDRDRNVLITTKGARRVKKLRGSSRLEKLRLAAGQDVQDVAAELRQNPAVELAEPNYLISRDEVAPNDPQFGDQWALRNTGQNGGQVSADISAAMAWETTTGSPSTVIAVIDSGIDFTHPDLADNQWTNTAEQANGVDDDHNGLVDDLHGWDWIANSSQIKDEAGHGTAIAGIIAAEGNNATGTTGVMWRAGLMSLRVLDGNGTGDVVQAVEAIDYAVAHGATVINCSWGTDGESTVLREAIERAAARQVVVVASAGNGARDVDAAPYYPASFDLPNVVAVAATNSSDQLTSTSDWGATRVTVAAPGADVLTTQMGGGYRLATGTSASTALVTGVAGLIRTVRPLLGAADTRAAIVNSSRRVADLAGKVSSGGVVSASGALGAIQGPDVQPSEDPTPTPTPDASPTPSPTPENGHGGGGDTGGASAEIGETDPPGEHGAPGGNLHDLEAERNEEEVEPQAPELIHADLCTTCTDNDDPPPGQTPNDPDMAVARTQPQNETGQPKVDLGSRNFNWSMPIVSLPGRAGLGLGLTLYYNSLVWTKQGSAMRFNADRGFPSAGFRLGWPTVQQKYRNAQGKDAYLMVMPSGARIEMESVGTNLYEAMDSSYTQLTDNVSGGAVVRTPDGTQLTFSRTVSVAGVSYTVPGGEMRCMQIKDRNGNFLTAEYDASARLTKIIDTLGRAVTFSYTSYGRLQYINQTLKNNTARRWATFTYGDLPIKTNFMENNQPLLIEGPQNNTTINVLTQVQLIDGSRYTFDYTTWGQVWKISRLTPDDDPTTTDYDLRAYTSYNLPQDETLVQSDCPRFTEQGVWAQYWNGDKDGVPNSEGGTASVEEAVTKYSVATDDSWTEVTMPDATKYKELFATTGWQKGLTVGTEFSVGTDKKKWMSTTWTQDDESLTYKKNPRVTENNVEDKEGNHSRSTTTYTTFTLPSGTTCNLPMDVREFDANATNVLRTTHLDYNLDTNYTGNSRRIIGLVSRQIIYKGNTTGVVASKVEYLYDETGGLVDTGGEKDAEHHDPTYNATFKWRGNQTGIVRYDVEGSATVKYSTAYNSTGLVVSTTDPLNHKTTISYADKYYNGTATPDSYNTWAYPTTVTDPDNYLSTAEYDFDYGVTERTAVPSGGTGSGVTYVEMAMTYDNVGRLTKALNKNNNSYTRWAYDASLMLVKSYQTIIATNKEAYSVQEFDGAGRVRGSAVEHPDITGTTPVDTSVTPTQKNRFSGQYFEYDKMGRPWRQSNPTEMDRNWIETGDDLAGGWRYTVQQYDWKGRPTITTNTDGSKKILSYDGCGCAGGEVVTATDERGRERKVTKDVLGRVVQVEEVSFNPTTDPSYMTTYTYDVLDNLLTMSQGAGTTARTRTLDYDGYGRLYSRKTPEQGTTTYTYNTDDTVSAVTSPSGTTTVSYNNRRMVTGIAYTAATGYTPPSNVTFSYDAAGHRTSMTDGLGSVQYRYNGLGQLTSEERTIDEVSTTPFTLSYLYNVGGELTKITNEKWSVNVGYTYDVIGRLSQVTGGGWGGVTSYIDSMEYRAFGGLKTVNYSNTKSLGITYDARLRVRQWNVASVMGWVYSYQYFGEKTGRVTFADSLNDTTQDRSYEYDHVGRLVRAETGSDARYHINPAAAPGTADGSYSQGYTYDQWGNMTANTGRGGTDYVPYSGLVFNVKNQRQGYVYDTAGNLKSDGTWGYTYDVEGQQLEAKLGGVVQLRQWYDGDGLRLKKEEIGSPTETTYYLRSSVLGDQVVAEFDASSQMKRGYVYMGGQMVALQDKNGTAQEVSWVHQDPVTKSQRFTSMTGTLMANRVDMDPWGIETRDSFSPEKQPHRYTTYERDKNKSDDAMHRRYTARRNRFDQPDPWNGSYSLSDPQSFNRYSYVHNDPVNFVDPSGLEEILSCYVDHVPVSCAFAFDYWARGAGDIIPSGSYFHQGHWIYNDRYVSSYNDAWRRSGLEFFRNLFGVQDKEKRTPDACGEMADQAQSEAESAAAGGASPGQALNTFDQNFSEKYLGHPVKTKGDGWDLYWNGVNGSTIPSYYRGSTGFKDEFKDSQWGRTKTTDQTHHFAAYFSAGINGQVTIATLHMLGDAAQLNRGDTKLGDAAYNLGKQLKNDPGKLGQVGKMIRDTICKK